MAGQRLVNEEVNKRVVIKPSKEIKRVNDGVNGLMYFGDHNDYPQLMEKLINGSTTAKSSANIYARFLAGQGFENEAINDIKIGTDSRGKRITVKSLLGQSCQSVSKNNGFYIHCNFNHLQRITSTHLKPFKNGRFAIPDDTGYSAKMLFYDNWEKDRHSKKYDKRKIKSFNVFNIEEKAFLSQIKEAGGIDKYKGQIYFEFFDQEFFYPLSNYDEVYLDCDTESQIALYKNRQIRNGFFKKTVIRTQPGGTNEEVDEFITSMRDSLGPDGDGLFIIADDLNEEGEIDENTAFKVEQLDSDIEDKLFESWEKTSPNNIRKAAKGLPAILIDYEQSNLGNTSGESVKLATDFYNAITKDDRATMEKAFEEILSNFDNEALQKNTNWKIKPLNLIEQSRDGITDTSGSELD